MKHTLAVFGLLYLLPHPRTLSANHWKLLELDVDMDKEVEEMVVLSWYWDIKFITLRLEKLLICFLLIVPTLDGVSSDTGTWND